MSITRNRKRGKYFEKKCAEILDGIRLGILGKEDIFTDDFSFECKTRKRLAFSSWWEQAQRNAKGRIPAVLCREFRKQRIYIILSLDDFLKIKEKGRQI